MDKKVQRAIGSSTAKEYILTLDCAKNLAMMEKKKGELVRRYFLLMENILKEYEKWSLIREPEKCGANDLKQSIKEWCERNDKLDVPVSVFYTQEFNMLNVCLTGFKAQDIRNIKNVLDSQTRNNLDFEVNNALHMLQFTDIALLNSNMSFEQRKSIIENTCNKTYKHIKDEFIKG